MASRHLSKYSPSSPSRKIGLCKHTCWSFGLRFQSCFLRQLILLPGHRLEQFVGRISIWSQDWIWFELTQIATQIYWLANWLTLIHRSRISVGLRLLAFSGQLALWGPYRRLRKPKTWLGVCLNQAHGETLRDIRYELSLINGKTVACVLQTLPTTKHSWNRCWRSFSLLLPQCS